MRKLKQWPRVSERWLDGHVTELLDQDFSVQDLAVLKARDVRKLTFAHVGVMLGLGESRARQIYERVRRRLCHPIRRKIVPARYRAKV